MQLGTIILVRPFYWQPRACGNAITALLGARVRKDADGLERHEAALGALVCGKVVVESLDTLDRGTEFARNRQERVPPLHDIQAPDEELRARFLRNGGVRRPTEAPHQRLDRIHTQALGRALFGVIPALDVTLYRQPLVPPTLAIDRSH